MLRAYNSVISNRNGLNFVFIVSVDVDDIKTLNSPELAYIRKQADITVCEGVSKNKIHAINRDVPATGWDILVNLSDDQIFTVKGFDELIAECKPDEFLHLPDGHVNELLPTLSVMGHEYYKRFGYIYHPDYASLWCDNEAMDVAIELGRYKYIDQIVFDHLHPAWYGGPVDKQLEHTQKFYRQDERTYLKRRAAGFPKISIFV